MTRAPGRRHAAVAALAALALAAAAPARAEEAPRTPKKPYDHYKLIETRNIFSPTATGGTASAAPATTATTRAPVLTGIVLDARTDTYKGLIETPGQADPLFIGAGEPAPVGRVVRVEPDRLVLQVESREIVILVGGTITPDGAPAESAPGVSSAPEDDAKTQEVLDRLKSKVGRKTDGSVEAGRPETAAPVVEEKHRSILDLLKMRRRRTPGEGEKKN
jgi:hypothetical protein